MLGRLHLCVITDARPKSGRDHLEIARAALSGGADMIQLRDKTGSLRDLLPLAGALRLLCRSHGALFIVNDRLDLALAAEADGAHVGQEPPGSGGAAAPRAESDPGGFDAQR